MSDKHKAARAAMLAFLNNYGRAKLVSNGAALTDANPDLKDNFTDALTDIVLFGRSLGLDMDSAVRCMAEHVTPLAQASDAVDIALAEGAPVFILHRTDEPFVGDWIEDTGQTVYPTPSDAFASPLGSKWHIFAVRPEQAAASRVNGYRIKDKL